MIPNEVARDALARIGISVLDIGEGRRGRFIADVPVECTHGHAHPTESEAWDDALGHLDGLLYPMLEDMLDHGHDVRFTGTDQRTIYVDGQEAGKAQDTVEALAAVWCKRFEVTT